LTGLTQSAFFGLRQSGSYHLFVAGLSPGRAKDRQQRMGKYLAAAGRNQCTVAAA
jgi:hypothetical protein